MHAASAHIAANQISSRSDLVDLININESELREVQITIGFVHQFAHQIFHIAADITGLAELSRVRLHKGHLDQIGDVFDQICFADPGRPDQDHVLLDVFDLLRPPGIFLLQPAQIIGMVVMIANGDSKDLLRLILFYDEPIEMRFNVARQEIEFEFLMVGLFRFLILFCCGLLRLGNRRDRDPIAEVLLHELRDLALQLFR